MFALFSIFLLSGFLHQLLYIVIPVSFFFTLILSNGFLIIKKYHYFLISIIFVLILFYIIQFNIELYSFKALYRYSCYIMLAIVLAQYNKEYIEKFFYLYITYLSISLFPYIYLYDTSLVRYSNIFEHANHFAYSLVILFLFILKSNMSLLYKLYSIVLISYSLILTQSTGAILTTILIGIVALFNYIKNSTRLKPYVIFTIPIFIVGVMLFVSQQDTIINSHHIEKITNIDFQLIETKTDNESFGGSGSAVWRLVYWNTILQSYFSQNLETILFGNGLDTLSKGNFIFPFMYTDPHNDFIKIIVEIGLVGFSLFILFLFFMYIRYKDLKLIISLTVPMFFGNILVNFPFWIIFLALITHIESENIKQKVPNEKH